MLVKMIKTRIVFHTISYILFIWTFALFGSCHQDGINDFTIPPPLKGRQISFRPTLEIKEVASSALRWTGVAVSDEERIFVNFPRWSDIPFSVAEIVAGQAIPFPNQEWNTWNDNTPADNHFVCVQSVYIDDNHNLWILDTGSIPGSGVIENGPKLLKVNLTSNTVDRIYPLDEHSVFGLSYPNDVRVDTELNFAYLSESGIGSLLVLDLISGSARRVLSDHSSTKAESITLNINGQASNLIIHADGIALSNKGDYLYYKALTAKSLYRIKTDLLRDPDTDDNLLNNSVEFVAQTMPSDGMEFDNSGNLFLTSIEDNAIYKMSSDKKLTKLISDERIKWPDSFSINNKGTIYFTTSRIAFPEGNHSIFKLINTIRPH